MADGCVGGGGGPPSCGIRLWSPLPPQVLALAHVLALFVGLLQVLLGFLRLGSLAHFLSFAVTTGFTTAAAVIIATSQAQVGRKDRVWMYLCVRVCA